LYSAQNGHTYMLFDDDSEVIAIATSAVSVTASPEVLNGTKDVEDVSTLLKATLPPFYYALSLSFPPVGLCVLCPWHPARHCTLLAPPCGSDSCTLIG